MTPPHLTSQYLRGVATTTLIGAGFALVWGLNGSLALPERWRVIVASVVVLMRLGMVAVSVHFYRSAGRLPPSTGARTTNPFRTTAYRAAVAAMLVALPVAGRTLTSRGHEDAVMPTVAIIVGLHFLGLVPAFRSGTFAWIAGGFCLVGVVALFLPVQVGTISELRYVVVGLGCALVLWFGALPLVATTLGQLSAVQRHPR